MRRIPGATTPEVKRHVREAAHSSPHTVNFKNNWSSNSSPLYAFMSCRGTPLFLPLSVVYIHTIMFVCICSFISLFTYVSMRRWHCHRRSSLPRWDMTSIQATCLLTSSASWLNKTFLQRVLSARYSTSPQHITKYEVKPAVGKGDNYGSDLYRVKVHTANGHVFHWIIKRQMSKDEGFGKMYRKSTAFLRETHMYSTTVVKLASIMQDALPGS